MLAEVKEIDTEIKTKLGFSDINKEKNIVSTNNSFEKYCIGNELFFIDDSNIHASCLSKSKLHINRKGTSY